MSGEVRIGAVGFLIGGGDREVIDLEKTQRATNEIEFAVCAFDFFVLIQGTTFPLMFFFFLNLIFLIFYFNSEFIKKKKQNGVVRSNGSTNKLITEP